MSVEERKIKVDFIKMMFKEKVSDNELQTDNQIEKIYKEAYSYSEWGL
jgi:hypothetical protein